MLSPPISWEPIKLDTGMFEKHKGQEWKFSRHRRIMSAHLLSTCGKVDPFQYCHMGIHFPFIFLWFDELLYIRTPISSLKIMVFTSWTKIYSFIHYTADTRIFHTKLLFIFLYDVHVHTMYIVLQIHIQKIVQPISTNLWHCQSYLGCVQIPNW